MILGVAMLAVSCDHRIPAGAGRTIRADELAARLPGRAWQRLSAGAGAKGQRSYDWAWITVRHPGPGGRWLLIRRPAAINTAPAMPLPAASSPQPMKIM